MREAVWLPVNLYLWSSASLNEPPKFLINIDFSFLLRHWTHDLFPCFSYFASCTFTVSLCSMDFGFTRNRENVIEMLWPAGLRAPVCDGLSPLLVAETLTDARSFKAARHARGPGCVPGQQARGRHGEGLAEESCWCPGCQETETAEKQGTTETLQVSPVLHPTAHSALGPDDLVTSKSPAVHTRVWWWWGDF